MEEKQVTVETSKKYSIDWQDAGKGLIVTAISAAITTVTTMLQDGGFDLKKVGTVAVIAGLGYLTKNFFQPSQTIVKVTPPIDETK